MTRPLTIITAAFILSLVAAVAAWGYTAQQQERELQRSVLVLVEETSKALRAMLALPGGSTETLAREASAAHARVDVLRRMDDVRASAFSEAAHRYLVSGHEILRGQLEMKRARERVPARVSVLARHVDSARSAGAWPDEVVRLKELVDDEFRNYRIAVEAYLALLQSFPSTQAAMRPYVRASLLLDDQAIERAKKHALDAFAAVNHETRLATDLDSFKPQVAVPRPRPASARKGATTRQKAQQKPRSAQKARSTQQKARSAQQKPRTAQKPRSASPQKATSGGKHGSRTQSGGRDGSGKRNR